MKTPPQHPPLPVAGFSAAGIAARIKRSSDADLMVIASDRPAAIAGVFTRNLVRAAPVLVSKPVVTGGVCRAIVANSGGANAYTEDKGMSDARTMCRVTADVLGVDAAQVAVASTGVIAQHLPMDRIEAGIPEAVSALAPDGWEAAADAIRTTDTVSKWHSARGEIGGTRITVTGIAKGSGMIHPNMATMLAFLVTDAQVAHADLQHVLARAVETSFNRITVDGDTSTNDCVLLLANGAAGGTVIPPGGPEEEAFSALIGEVCDALARQIVTDGEGATKTVDITIRGAADEAAALAIARQVATSSLVKTALFGADPNWGRIIAAAGQAGIDFDWQHASLSFDDCPLVAKGAYLGADAEAAAAKIMGTDAYRITLTVGDGPGTATVVTCDLSYDYIKINADYRT